MGYYPAIKRSKVLIHATTWINFENMMLSERKQSPKIIYCMILILSSVQKREIYRDREYISIAKSWKVGREWELSANGYGISEVVKMF